MTTEKQIIDIKKCSAFIFNPTNDSIITSSRGDNKYSCKSQLTFTDGTTEMIYTTEKEFSDILFDITTNQLIGNPVNTKEISDVILTDGIVLFRNPPCVHVKVYFSDGSDERQVWTVERLRNEYERLGKEDTTIKCRVSDNRNRTPTTNKIVNMVDKTGFLLETEPPRRRVTITYSNGATEEKIVTEKEFQEFQQSREVKIPERQTQEIVDITLITGFVLETCPPSATAMVTYSDGSSEHTCINEQKYAEFIRTKENKSP